MTAILCLVITGFLVDGTRKKREAAYWEDVIAKEEQTEYGVVFPEIEPKSVAIQKGFLALLQSDGTVRLFKSDSYGFEQKEWNEFCRKVSSLRDVRQVMVPAESDRVMLVALKNDGTLYSTEEEQQTIIQNWSHARSIVRAEGGELIVLSETGKIYQYDSGESYVSDICGIVDISYLDHLFIRGDGTVLCYTYPDSVASSKQQDGWIEARKSLASRGKARFSPLLELNDVVSIRECTDMYADYGYMVLRKDGSIWYLPKNGKALRKSEALLDQDFIQMTGGYAVAGLKRDGTVKIYATENCLENYETVNTWTDIVSLYTDQNLLIGVTKDGELRTAGIHRYFGSEIDSDTEKPKIADFGIQDIMVE